MLDKARSVYIWVAIAVLTMVYAPISIFLGLFDRRGIWSHRSNCMWAKTFMCLIGAKWTLQGEGGLSQMPPSVFVANHEGQADIPIFMCRLPLPFKFISKREVFRTPLIGWCMSAAHYVSVHRGKGRDHAKDVVDQMAGHLLAGSSAVMFPEGTRSRDGNLGEFKSGPFRLAVQAKVPIVPVGLAGSQTALPVGDWVIRPPIFLVGVFGDPILPTDNDTWETLRDKSRAEVLRLREEARGMWNKAKETSRDA